MADVDKVISRAELINRLSAYARLIGVIQGIAQTADRMRADNDDCALILKAIKNHDDGVDPMDIFKA